MKCRWRNLEAVYKNMQQTETNDDYSNNNNEASMELEQDKLKNGNNTTQNQHHF